MNKKAGKKNKQQISFKMRIMKLLKYFIKKFRLQIFGQFFLAIYLRIKTSIYIIANVEEKPLEQTVNHAV